MLFYHHHKLINNRYTSRKFNEHGFECTVCGTFTYFFCSLSTVTNAVSNLSSKKVSLLKRASDYASGVPIHLAASRKI